MVLRNVMVGAFVMLLVLMPLNASAGELTAGDFDDNLNFDHYLDYVEGTKDQYPGKSLEDRVTFMITDKDGTGVANAHVTVTRSGASTPLIDSFAGTDGVFHFFPAHDGAKDATTFTVLVRPPTGDSPSRSFELDLDTLGTGRTVDVRMDGYTNGAPGALDIMLVVDTTGSMSDELRYFIDEFSDIIGTVKDSYPNVSMRFALIVYRDQGDEYVVRSFAFTSSLSEIQQDLSEQGASGGGDYPEAMDKALNKAVKMQWRGGNTARMLFLVADAPPHDDKMEATLDHVGVAREKGIHIYPLAASGVADSAEYIMRASAVLTNGRYMFLTDDSGIGNSHAEPHIPCYLVTPLDNLFVRVVASELAGKRVEPDKEEVIRQVGEYNNGVCKASGSDGDEDPKPDPRVELTASDGARPYAAKDHASGGELEAVPLLPAHLIIAALPIVAIIKVMSKRMKRELE